MAPRKVGGGRFPAARWLIALLLVAVVVIAFIPFESPARVGEESLSGGDYEKVIIPDSIPNEMLRYVGFTVAFNPRMHQPNYVVWTLDPHETDGEFTRNNVQFMPDETVTGCATLEDYYKSGFDRGHMAPAADMKWSREAMIECHYLTNMCPQDKSLNAGAWATVEKNARKWAMKHGSLVIVCGPILSDRLTREIGPTPVPVPERFFKVILALNSEEPMGIGFIMPNSYVEDGAQATVVSIDRVEEVTGFDFFSDLPDDIEDNVESQANLSKWNH